MSRPSLQSDEGEPAPSKQSLPLNLLDFCDQLRSEGVRVGTTEILDAFESLKLVSWDSQSEFKEALAASIAKSQEERRIFDLVFERFIFRAAEEGALSADINEYERLKYANAEADLQEMSEAVAEAIRNRNESQMRDLARLAVSSFGTEGEGSGVVGVDVQRIRRNLGLSRNQEDGEGQPLHGGGVKEFEKFLREELERQSIQRTGELPPSRPLAQLDRSLPTSPTQDLLAVHRTVGQMKRRLATIGHEARGHARSSHVDIRHTLRASLETGGVPLRLKHRPRRPRRPEIYVLCDVSTSVSSASVFFLSVLHALHDSFRKLRSFVFIERISEVTDVFASERDFKAIAERISNEGGVADLSGYTDYGRVWQELYQLIADDLGPRSTVIVLGDARTNGREPHAKILGEIAKRSGRSFWLNPEPQLYWNYGDSVMAAYEPYLDGAFECWTTKQLEEFVNMVARVK